MEIYIKYSYLPVITIEEKQDHPHFSFLKKHDFPIPLSPASETFTINHEKARICEFAVEIRYSRVLCTWEQ